MTYVMCEPEVVQFLSSNNPEMEANLFNLESILDEFYSPYCTNERRKQIDDVLSRFFQQNTCMSQALYFLQNSHQDYTRTFAINILQACVLYNWHRYQISEQLELRCIVRQFLYNNAQTSQYYVLNKLCKLIADVARCEWPEKDADYFNYVMALIQSNETQLAGLTLLRATFEEFISPKESMSVKRRSELSTFLNESVPNVLQFLVTLMQNLFVSREQKYEKSLISECLQTLNQMLSWISLTNNLNNPLVMTLLSYCHVPSCVAGQPYQPGDDSLSLLAMDCVNEIMAKKCVPKDVETFLLTIYNHTMAMIAIECEYPESFLYKLVFFLQLLASSQFARFESLEIFPLEVFLAQLLKFTFRQEVSEIYLSCLEVWAEILDHLKLTADKRDPNTHLSAMYKTTIVDLNSKILAKVTFAANQSFLDELDDELLDEDKETEYEKFQRINLEIMVSSCDIYPSEILSALGALFSGLLNDFKTIVSCIHKTEVTEGSSPDSNLSPYQLLIRGEYDNLRLHCKLRDLATISRLVGMVNGSFFSSIQMQSAEAIGDNLPRQFLNGLLYICKMNLQYSLYKIEGAGLSETLHSDFSNLLALSLGAFQLMINWMSAFLGQVVKLGDKNALQEIETITDESFKMAHELIQSFDSSKVVFTRLMSQIVYSHTNTVKANFLLKLPGVFLLMKSTLAQNFTALPLDVQCKFIQAMCLAVIRSWTYNKDIINEYTWDSREPILKSWVSELFQTFHSLSQKSHLETSDEVALKRSLTHFSSLVKSLSGEGKKAREVCLGCVQSFIEDVMILCSNHFPNASLCAEILNAYHNILENLKWQLGPEKTSLVIGSLMKQLTPEKVQQIFCRSATELEIDIISNFMKTLMKIAEESSKKFLVFLPGIISFVCGTISPLINQDNYYSPDCITSLLDLIFQIINVHWSKFIDQSETLTSSQFIQLVRIFGQCLLFPDINVYKHAINAMQRLNEVFGLYNQEIFKTNLRDSFLALLITRLIDRSQLLNEDETLQSVHALMLVDSANFNSFMLNFLNSHCSEVPQQNIQGLLQDFHPDNDYPTFSLSLSHLIAEINYLKSLYAPTDGTAINFTNLTQ